MSSANAVDKDGIGSALLELLEIANFCEIHSDCISLFIRSVESMFPKESLEIKMIYVNFV